MALSSISDDLSHYYLCCVIAGEEFSIPLLPVRQVLLRPHLVEMESPPEDVIGLTTWDRNVIPVVNPARKLLVPAPALQEVDLVLVVAHGSEFAGIAVDGVKSLFREGGRSLEPPRMQEGFAVNLGAVSGLVTPLDGGPSMWSLDLAAICNFSAPVATEFESIRKVERTGLGRDHGELFVTFAVGQEEYALRLASLRRLMHVRKTGSSKFASVEECSPSIPLLDLSALLASISPLGSAPKVPKTALPTASASPSGGDPLRSDTSGVTGHLRRLVQWAVNEFQRRREADQPSVAEREQKGNLAAVPDQNTGKGNETVLVLEVMERDVSVVGIAAHAVTGLIRRSARRNSAEDEVLLLKSSQDVKRIRWLHEDLLIHAKVQQDFRYVDVDKTGIKDKEGNI